MDRVGLKSQFTAFDYLPLVTLSYKIRCEHIVIKNLAKK